MIDIDLLRETPEVIEESVRRRGQEDKLPLIQQAVDLDSEWRSQKGSLDELRRERNEVSESINKTKKAGGDASALIEQAKQLPGKIEKQEALVSELREKIDEILLTLPNMLDEQVPDGADEEENVVIESVGEPAKLSFAAKSHVEILEELGLADFDAARRTSGKGFFFLKGSLALLDQALQQYALDVMLDEGFTPVVPPYFIRREVIDGVVDMETFNELVFKVEDEDLYPIATSEHSLVGMLTGSDTPVQESPTLLCGISPCFRKELGAHGIDEKGLFRTHQFHKVEQVVVCKPEDSRAWFEKLLGITQKIFSGLGLPIRALEMCTGDLGDLKSRQVDWEVFSPRREGYFEVGSCSNLTDAQARRLTIRLRLADGERVYAHTLNNTAIATSRAMVAIIENFQNADGTVDIPEVLHPYMRGVTKLK